MARETGARLQISHLKAEAGATGARGEMLARIDAKSAPRASISVTSTPYTAFMTGLWVVALPAWAQGDPARISAAGGRLP